MYTTLILFLLLGSACAAPHRHKSTRTASDPWEEFLYSVELDVAGKYWMFWTPDDEAQTITFEVHVEALGYVGFGISPNGGMTGADVVIGWVYDDGTAVFHDRHALGEYEPIIDESQDVTLLASSQNDTHTILRFSRPYVTCDENDRDITDDTIRVIFSFTDTDPEDITGLSYHGSANRGTKSVILLSYNEGEQSLPEDAISMDILITEVEVPQKRTTYWCEFIKIPQMEQKHHIVMFEPVIKPGNEGLVHHIVLYACTGDIDDDTHGVAWDCINQVMPEQYQCLTTMFVWAVGGNPFYFPEHTGLPFFSPGENNPLFMRMEMHYDNPSRIAGAIDDSGFRIHMTPTLREYDIGVLAMGNVVKEEMMIPPYYPELTYRGHCTPNCRDTALDDQNINVFAVYQHAHLLGRKIKTRLYRDGVELEPLMRNDNYDFNFQESRMLKEERIIQPNDLMVIDCTYDSSHKQRITPGGFATNDEMCASYLYYYPLTNVSMCMTNPAEFRTVQVVDGIELEKTADSFRITAPPEFVNKTVLEVFQALDWTNETLRNRYQDILLDENAVMSHTCIHITTRQQPLTLLTPELGDDWIDPDDGQCDETTKHKNKSKVDIKNIA